MKKTPITITIFLLTLQLTAQNFSNGFNFVLPPYDFTSQTFLPEFPAYNITEAHRVTAGNDGKFYSNGQPIRFWGVNMTSQACFPEKADAPGIAARMRKMGINLARFHHLDNPSWAGNNTSIFYNDNNGTRQLNPVTQDRLEYFIAQLKANGIFVNMNLNVSRTFQDADEVMFADSLVDFAKGATLFDPWMQFLQKEFAEQLLSHVNPYTGMTMAEDPVIAMVEMVNENTIYRYWKLDNLKRFAHGGNLLYRHEQMLDDLWNDWLLAKYGDDATLAAAWNVGATASGQNLLQEGDFESGVVEDPWFVETHGTADATVSADNQNPYEGTYSGLFNVTQGSSESWHLQFKNVGCTLESGEVYELTFAARANGNYSNMSAAVMRDNSPYNWYDGIGFSVTTDWDTYSLTFTAPEDNNGFGRVTLGTDNQTGQFWFDDFVLIKTGKVGVMPGENFAAQTYQRFSWSERHTYTDQRMSDLAAFYMHIQKAHYDDLSAYLRNDLSVLAPITGSNALAGPTDAAPHADLDYLDDHSYWDHPSFQANGPWLLRNEPMVEDSYFGAISGIFSGQAFADKPYTISEYNHCFPNRYRTEMLPALLSYGSFHGLDGIMFFEYSSRLDWDTDWVDGFFNLHRDHSVMSLFPSFSYAFREGLVQESPSQILLNYTTEWLEQSPINDNTSGWNGYTPFDTRLALTYAIKTSSYDAVSTTDFNSLPAVGSSPYTTETEETTLDTDNGFIKTATDKFVTIGGFLENATGQVAGDLTLQNADGFGTLSWLSLTSTPLSNSSKALLSLSSRLQNTGMVWTDNNRTVDDENGGYEGNAPTELETRNITIELHIEADYIRLYPLDELGQEHNYTEILPSPANTFTVTLNQANDETTWWGVEAFGGQVVLSVEQILNLTATLEMEAIRLDWQSNAANDQPFVIQKSKDLQNWTNLGLVEIKNNSEDYHFIDNQPFEGQNYYRIQQEDKNKNLRFSNIAEAFYSSKGNGIQLMPNPAQTEVVISLKNGFALPVEWELIDLDGKIMQSGKTSLTYWTLDLKDLASGIYAIKVRGRDGFLQVERLVVQ